MRRDLSQVPHRYAELPVDQIACYAKNPRVTQNPEYERLKNSLRKNGLDMPLVVTREPGAENYTLQAGGNTRLSIAQALHDSGSEEFATVPCIVKDWRSELHVLVSHLRENDMRGNLMFIERALGVMSFANMIGSELGRTLSQRELAKQLFEFGYALSQPVISAMDYAVNRLYGLLPTALEHGMGKRQVATIRGLEHVAIKVWDQHLPDEAGEFAELFAELCKSCDGSVFDSEELTAKVAHEISVATELDINTVRMLLESERAGSMRMLETIAPIEVDETRKTENDEVEPREADPRREMQRLRSRMVASCASIAAIHELSECVRQTPDERFGYFMCELPRRNAPAIQRAVWKLLATACDQGRATKRTLLRILDEHSVYAVRLANARPKDVYGEMASMDLFDLGERLLAVLDEVSWNHATNLLSSYRSLKELAGRLELNLWADA